MAIRVDLNISLDGFATTTDQMPENPFGNDWSRLVEAYAATRTIRERVFKDTSGKGTIGIDDSMRRSISSASEWKSWAPAYSDYITFPMFRTDTGGGEKSLRFASRLHPDPQAAALHRNGRWHNIPFLNTTPA